MACVLGAHWADILAKCQPGHATHGNQGLHRSITSLPSCPVPAQFPGHLGPRDERKVGRQGSRRSFLPGSRNERCSYRCAHDTPALQCLCVICLGCLASAALWQVRVAVQGFIPAALLLRTQQRMRVHITACLETIVPRLHLALLQTCCAGCRPTTPPCSVRCGSMAGDEWLPHATVAADMQLRATLVCLGFAA